MKGIVLAVVVSLASASAFSGCADLAARMRRHTYPPNFQYITREQLRSTMWQLGQYVQQLDRNLRQPPPVDEERRALIVRVLIAIERATDKLGTQGWPSNHPLIDANLDTFRRDVVQARRAVERDPPHYFLAGSVSGACMYCHGGRE